MIADRLISRLDHVRETGPDRWIARCPAHEDRSPSLAIREMDDRLLLHCFAGCSVNEVVAVVGLSISDLFPEIITLEGNRPLRRPFPAEDILRCVSSEAMLVQFCATDLAAGQTLTPADLERLNVAATRIRAGMLAGGISC